MTHSQPTIICNKEELQFSGGRIRFLQGADSIRTTMTLLEVEGATLLVDCGANPFAAPVELPDEAYEADAVLLTHAHLDHMGGIPALLTSGFHAPIIATETTLAVTRITLSDFIRQQGGAYREVRAFIGGLDHISRGVAFGVPVAPFSKKNLTVTFHPAGHMLGAASVEIRTQEVRLLFSGDVGPRSLKVAGAPNTRWTNGQAFDVVVLESTCGDVKTLQTADEIKTALAHIIQSARQRGGHIVVPAAPIGRSQELMMYLQQLGEEDDSLRVPVALDSTVGLRIANEIEPLRAFMDESELCKRSREDDPLNSDGLFTVRKTRDPKKLSELDKTTLIISGFGSCEEGRIVSQLQELLPLAETTLLLIGPQAPDSIGHQLLSGTRRNPENAQTEILIDGEMVPVRAAVHSIPGLFAHAIQPELVGWVHQLPEVKCIALHHGSQAAQRALAAALVK